MNNVIKFGYIIFPHSKNVLLINVLGNLIYKFLFYCKGKALKPDEEHHFLKRCDNSSTEDFNVNDLLQFYASINHGEDVATISETLDDKIDMKNPLDLVYSFIFDFLKSESVVKGVSVEEEVFVMKNKAITMNACFRTVSRSTDLIFKYLITRFLKLLYSPEIIDLIIEKNSLEKLQLSVVVKTEELYNGKIYEKVLQIPQESSDKTESITSFTVISSGKITINANKCEISHSQQTSTEIQEWQLSKLDCQANGDIHRLQISSNVDDDKFTAMSRIFKATNWIKNHVNPQESEQCEQSNHSSCSKKSLKIKKSTKKFKSTQLKQRKTIEKFKLPRFIVKKSEVAVKNSTNNSSTNLITQKKQAKIRFTVLKTKSNSQESQLDKMKKMLPKKLTEKSTKTPKFMNTNILSSIRQDVLNLANELHQNYLRHSKLMVSPSKTVPKPFGFQIRNQKPIKKDILLEEVRKRLQRQPKFRKNEYKKNSKGKLRREKLQAEFNSESLDTLNGLKSINSKRQDSFSHKYDTTLSLLSSSNNIFHSNFLTISDNSVTSYRSIESDSENSLYLNSHHLRDIHLITDEIHGLAQKELMKTL